MRSASRLLPAGVAVAAAALLLLQPRASSWTAEVVARIRDADAAGLALYVAVYAAATVALLPGSILTLAAGFAFGPALGVAAAWSGAMAGAMLAFLLGRTVLRDWARRRLARAPRARALDRAVARESFKVVLLLRLSPVVPFNLLNYALSLAPVPFGHYVAATAVGMLPVTVLYVYLGSLATTAAGLDAGAAPRGVRVALGLVGLAAIAAVVIVVARAARRALDEELAPPSSATPPDRS